MKRTATASMVGLLLYLGAPVHTFAQVSATVVGTVTDATGASIPGVTVKATNVNTGIVVGGLSNEAGSYTFPALQPGAYTLSAELPGFRSEEFKSVQLSQGQQIRMNFTLQVATSVTAVDVVADTSALLTTSASVGNVLAERSVTALPVQTRNVLDLLGALPGVEGHNNVSGNGFVHFAGTATNQINTTRDGMTTTDGRYDNGVYSSVFTSSDLVEEVQVVINNVDSSVGRGSGQVRMQTRSGGNAFHGAMFYENHNSAIQANDWFSNLSGAQKSYRNQNQFGGRLGGPIKQNKAFFFVLYDGQRYVEKVNVVSTVLTSPARQGIFQYLTQNATGANGGISRQPGNAFSTTPSVNLAGKTLTADPVTGAPLFLNTFNLFTDVKDPNRTKIDPVWFSPQYLTRMPLPNNWTVGDGLNTAGFQWQRHHSGLEDLNGTSQTDNRDNLSARFDYQVSTKNKANFTMTRERDWGVTGQTGLPDYPAGYFGDVQRLPYFYTASFTSAISPTLLNEFTWGRKQDVWQGTSPFDKGCCWNGKGQNDIVASSAEARASFPQVTSSFVFVQPGLGLGSYAPFGTSSPRDQLSPTMQFTDKLSWTKGHHSFQSGFEATYTGTNQNNHGAAGVGTTRPLATLGLGNIPVPNLTTANFPGLSATSVTTAQTLLANLAGTVTSINYQDFINSPSQTDWLDYRNTIIRIRNLRKNDWGAFWKDTWTATSHLTLTLGLRYDKYGTPYDATGLGGRPAGGQAGLFGISGTSYSNAMWNPYASGGSLTTVQLAGKGSPNPQTLLYNNDWKDFAPSVGFSWSMPSFKRPTSLRGGYGINYTGASSFLTYSAQIGNIPGTTLSLTDTPATYLDVSGLNNSLLPLSTGGAVPLGPIPVTNRTAAISGYADNRKTPYIQSFNLALQRELTRDLSMTVSWVATKGTKLWSTEELNYTNIFENGILDAFNVTRAGGNAPLFDKIFTGLNVPGAGVVNGTTLTGSQALRKYTSTNAFLANGDVGAFASFLNSSSALTTLGNGGLLRRVNLPENFIVVNPQFGSVQLQGNSSNSTYHSLQLTVIKRLSRGFNTQFSYTRSKALGDGSIRDPRNWHLSKGLQSFDRPNDYKATGTWDLPFGANRALLAGAPAVVQRIVGGWQLSSIFSRTDGAPLGFSSTLTTMGARTSNTADLVGTLPANLGKVVKGNGFVQYFSPLSVVAAPQPSYGGDATLPGRFTNMVIVDGAGNTILQNPRPGTTGNSASALSLRGPALLGLDVALSKQIRIDDKRTVTIRANAINILNKPQWGDPSTAINSTSFGRITTASGSRTIGLNARMDF